MDSLKTILFTLRGEPKADALNAIGNFYKDKNADSSRKYANLGLSLSQAQHYPRGTGEAYRILGWTEPNITQKKNDYESALNFFRSISYTKGIADTKNNLGYMFAEVNDSLALACYDSALFLYRQLGDHDGEGTMLIYSNVIYASQGNFTRAIDYALKGLDARKKTNNYLGIVYGYINAGNVYLEGEQYESALTFFNLSISYAIEHSMQPMDRSYNLIGRLYLETKQYDKATEYLLRSKTGNHAPYLDNLLIGELYLKTGKPDSALFLFKKTLSEINGKRRGDFENKARAMTWLSKTYLQTGNKSGAKQLAKSAYAISDSLHNKRLLADAALVLESLYESENNFQQAFQYFRQAHQIKDSVLHEYNENFQRKLAEYQSKGAIEAEQDRNRLLSAEKELQVQRLKNEQQVKYWILSAAFLLILAAAIVIYIINAKRKQIHTQKEEIAKQKVSVEEALTRLKAMQAQLIQSEKMASLGELTAGIAHEIQNPLNFVNNFSALNKELLSEAKAELAQGKISDTVSLLDDLISNSEKISNHGKRAEGIVKGMLQHSHILQGTKENTDINLLVQKCLRVSRQNFQTKYPEIQVKLIQKYEEGLPAVSLIPQEIDRVLLNIYENAFYALHEMCEKIPGYKPEIQLQTSMQGDRVLVQIRDNGPGIPQNQVNKIFQPFFTTKPAGQGTGLGLSISYDIIKSHGGEIKVNSEFGSGTGIILELPVNNFAK